MRLKQVSIGTAQKGFAWKQAEIQKRLRVPQSSKSSETSFVVLAYELHFADFDSLPVLEPLQVGVLLAEINHNTGVAQWDTNMFYVPPALDGAGFIGRFLQSVVNFFKDDQAIKELRVTILDPGEHNTRATPRRDPASRQRRSHMVEFYRSRGFNYDRSDGSKDLEFNQVSQRFNRDQATGPMKI